MRDVRRDRVASLLAALLLAAACERSSEAADVRAASAEAPPMEEANVVTVTAGDFYYQAPKSVPAGLTTIRLVNRGEEFHHVQLVRLEAGRTVPELLEHLAEGGPAPPWARFVGGPNSPAPGGESEATLRLEPGEYALICTIPSPDGVLHVAKGMAVPMTVAGSAPSPAAEPPADLEMVLSDYAYELSSDIAAGRRTVRVENAAEQPHEVVFFRLAPGKQLADLLAWFRTHEGPPPAVPVGGTSMLDRGEVNHVTVDFEAGEYALLCLIPDRGDGRPHIAHGMARQIRVR